MKYKTINEAVLYNDEPVCTLSRHDINHLTSLGLATKEQRTRLCVHESPEDLVHEMFIVHTLDTYVRPHRHQTKSESFFVLQGAATLVLFDDSGVISRVVELGDIQSDKTFYFKLPALVWHALIIRSDVITFKEVTQGPFDTSDCEFPDWAPAGRRVDEVTKYVNELDKQITKYYE